MYPAAFTKRENARPGVLDRREKGKKKKTIEAPVDSCTASEN